MPLRSSKRLALGLPAILVGVLVAHGSGIVATSREYSATIVLIAALATPGLIIQRPSSRRRLTYQPSARASRSRRALRPNEGAEMSTISKRNLEGQRALVTGATSGIGRAVALQLAHDGAEVMVHGRDGARGAQTVNEITAAGGRASFIAADLGNAADVERLASDACEVDILINNAGISVFGPTAEFDIAAFDEMFASNVRAPFLLVAALAPGMAAREHGSIVSLSSMAGGVGLVGGAAYGATKASLEAMTRAWAAEYSARGVRVNAIAPGPVYTPTPSGPEFITALGETTPMHRASQPEEIAEVISFLASPRASYITGATVAADGGRRAI
jgi:NAD(P)-dependent dehydrogenase (short-subunit alcohol dehydrogenase family)